MSERLKPMPHKAVGPRPGGGGIAGDALQRLLVEWLRKTHVENCHRFARRLVRQTIHRTCSQRFFRRSLRACHQDRIVWPNDALGCFVLSFDLDWREDNNCLPTLLQLLNTRGLTSSIAAIGRWVEQYPEAYRSAVATGHEVFNHTYSHPDSEELGRPERFNEIGLADRIEEIERGDEALRRVLGIEPKGFRAPHFSALNTTDILPCLVKLGYSYSASTIAFRTPGYGLPHRPVSGLWEFPVSGAPREFFRLLGTYDIRRAPKPLWRDESDFLIEWRALLEAVVEFRAFGSAFLDPMDLFFADGALGVGLLDALEAARDRGLWVTTYGELAEWLNGRYPGAAEPYPVSWRAR
ncbi:MAG: polysaccharide deacetylase family protein [Verrucomicrobiota bacterium]|jgi:hypothetical protein